MSSDHAFVRSARLISLLTLASRILGLAREMTFSHFFGAGAALSAFRVAFQVPNLARRLFGEGALTSSFLPIFTRLRLTDGDLAARQLTGGVLTLLTIFLTGVVIVVEIGVIFAMRFSNDLTLLLVAVLMPYMVLICLTAFLAGVLHALNRFVAPALAPILLNVVIIAAAWAGGAGSGLTAARHLQWIAISILGAGVLQILLQIAWLSRLGFLPRTNWAWRNPSVRRVIRLMAPMILGLSAVQLNTFIDSMVAFFFVEDGRGPAVLGFAQYVSHLPLALFGTAVAIAIFPTLAQRAADRDFAGLADSLSTGLRTSLAVTIPAGVGLVMLADPLVRLLFEHGAFSPEEAGRVTLALRLYATAIWAYAAQQILVRSFYCLEDSATPARIAVGMMVFNFVLNMILVRTPLLESGVALATALTATCQIAWLTTVLVRRLPLLRMDRIARLAGKALVSTTVMAGSVWGAMRLLANQPDWIRLTVAVGAGAGVYLVTARLLGVTELDLLLSRRRPQPPAS